MIENLLVEFRDPECKMKVSSPANGKRWLSRARTTKSQDKGPKNPRLPRSQVGVLSDTEETLMIS